MKSPNWTPAQDLSLQEFAAAGMTLKQAANALGRTPRACGQRRYIIGCTKKSGKKKAARTAPRPSKVGQIPIFDFDKAIRQPAGRLPGDTPAIEEQHPGGLAVTVRETIGLEAATPGSILFMTKNGQVDMQVRGLSPKQVVKILSALISKIV
jgi:hypothetical protein